MNSPDPVSLWATYSVRDHLEPNRFIADVLIYDHLLVPVPAKDEKGYWEDNLWKPDLQSRLLDAIKDVDQHNELLLEVPWDKMLREFFKDVIRDDKGWGIKGDESLRELHNALEAMKNEGRKDAALQGTSGIIAAIVKGNIKHPLVDAFFVRVTGDGAQPEPVLAYHSIDDLKREQGIGDPASPDQRRADITYKALNWKIKVPATDSDELDVKKLKAAVALALDEEWRADRKAFNGWIKGLADRAVSPEVACEALTPLFKRLDAYYASIRTRKVIHEVKRFSAIPLAAAGLVFPEMALAAIIAGYGIDLAVEHFLPVNQRAHGLAAAAYVHKARAILGKG